MVSWFVLVYLSCEGYGENRGLDRGDCRQRQMGIRDSFKRESITHRIIPVVKHYLITQTSNIGTHRLWSL